MENMPVYLGEKFKCQHCEVLAKQSWFTNEDLIETINAICKDIFFNYRINIEFFEQENIRKFLDIMEQNFPKQINKVLPSMLYVSKYQSCEKFSIWFNEKIIYPRTISIEPPNEDLNDDIKALYNEASKIFLDSPRGASALLRLALEKLLIQIGIEENDINRGIAKLVKSGKLHSTIQKALDIIRVIGNNAVHHGQINIDDNKDTALELFNILNMIADDMITRHKVIDNNYQKLPKHHRTAIEKRDGKIKK